MVFNLGLYFVKDLKDHTFLLGLLSAVFVDLYGVADRNLVRNLTFNS